MKAAKAVLFLSLILALSRAGQALETVDLDLTLAGGTISVPPGALEARIVNRVPTKDYSISTVKQTVVIPPFSLATLQAQATSVKALINALPTCQTAVLDPFTAALQAAGDEKAVKLAIAQALTAAVPHGEQCKKQVELLAATTTQHGIQETLDEGEELIVTVERPDPATGDANRKKTWKFVLTTGPRGRWLTHYGFSFLQDRDRTYFTEGVGTDDFVIQRRKDHDSYDYEPTVVFTWVPASLQLRQWTPAFAAGIGIDFNRPVVFAGIAALIGDNVNIFAGLAGHKQKRLDGKYHTGQHVKESLEGANLEEDVFNGNVVVGVGFRFDGNPFKKAEDKKDDKKAGQGGGTQ